MTLSFAPKRSSDRTSLLSKPILMAEWFKFYRRGQLEGKSIVQFVLELKRLSLKCEFGLFLEEAMHDRLVCGLRNVHFHK